MLSGQVRDEQETPLAGIYLMLLQDTALLMTAVADVDGKFVLEGVGPGTYRLKLSQMDYETDTAGPVAVSGHTMLPAIVMKTQQRQLGEVTIKGQRPFIEVMVDKIVVNAANRSIPATGKIL